QNVPAVRFAKRDAEFITNRLVNFLRVLVMFQRRRKFFLIEEKRAEFEIGVGDLRLGVALFGEIEFLIERLKRGRVVAFATITAAHLRQTGTHIARVVSALEKLE